MTRSKKMWLTSVYVIGTTFFGMIASFSAHPQDIMAFPHVYAAKPSKALGGVKVEKLTVKYMCVGRHDGKSYGCSIDSELKGIRDSEDIERFKITNLIKNIPDLNGCSNTTNLDVEELLIYGGHVDDKTGGLGAGKLTLDRNNYLLDGSAAGDGQYFVEGETKTDVASELEYDTPIRSGVYTAFTTLITPESPSPSFIWVFKDGRTINYHLDRHIIAIEEFSRIPGCPDGKAIAGQQYTLTRGATDLSNHPEGHWGLSGTLKVAQDVANEVFKTYGRHVSYNDFSMPLGGYSHHQTHRSGKDIDFNPSAMKYSCTKLANKDRYIHNAFAALYGFDHLVKGKTSTSPNDSNFPNLHCYEDNRMHIDAVPGY